MNKRIRLALLSAPLIVSAACMDLAGTNNRVTVDPTLAAAFQSVPVAYSSAQNSYDATAEGTGPFFPASQDGGMGPGRGRGHEGEHAMGGGMGPMMGLGLGIDFLGGRGLGSLMGRGRHGDPDVNSSLANCTFNATSGRVECNPVTGRHGLTIVRSIAYADSVGAVQQAFDTIATDRINTRVAVSGTVTRRDSAVTVVAHSSERTVTGLRKGSTQHTVNGVAGGTESTTGTDSSGAFSVLRTAADTISGIVVPVSDTGRAYPTAGSIVRTMAISRTSGGSTRTASRREVITYDGSAVAKLVVTQNGTTKTCTIPLPHGRPTCQ